MRDEVFANAQTGNIVLMSTHFMKDEWVNGLRYLLPLLAFVADVLVSAAIGTCGKQTRLLNWRQIVLILGNLLKFTAAQKH